MTRWVWMVCGAWWGVSGCTGPRPFLTVFDVGQGDALRVMWDDGVCMWVDFGTEKQMDRQSGMPFVRERHRCQQSWYVVSHFDADHIGGIYALMDRIFIAAVIFPRSTGDSRRTIHQEAFRKRGIAMRDTFPSELQNRVEVLWPLSNARVESPNSGSLVLRVWDSHHRICALLTGDIPAAIEQTLVQKHASLSCAILKIAHHGSATSSSETFVRAVSPTVALISNGWNNSYGHPHRGVLKRLSQNVPWVFRTDWMGRIDVRVTQHHLDIETPKGRLQLPL